MIYGVPSFHWWNPAPGASSCRKSSSDRRSNVSELTGLGLPMANCSNEEAAESMAKVVLSPNRVPESTQGVVGKYSAHWIYKPWIKRPRCL